MTKQAKQEIMGRLRWAGLWPEASKFREDVRNRHKEAGDQDAADHAWREMWAVYCPVVERLEQAQSDDTAFVGYQGDVDELINPDYNEPNAGRRFRDAWVWVGDEFRRITTDSPNGTKMDFSKAKSLPPSPLAVQVAEFYGANPGKRAELLTKLAGFATKTHSHDEPSDEHGGDDDSFLHLIGDE